MKEIYYIDWVILVLPPLWKGGEYSPYAAFFGAEQRSDLEGVLDRTPLTGQSGNLIYRPGSALPSVV